MLHHDSATTQWGLTFTICPEKKTINCGKTTYDVSPSWKIQIAAYHTRPYRI